MGKEVQKDVCKKKNDSAVLLYTIIISFLCCLVIFVYDTKTNGITNWFNSRLSQSPPVERSKSSDDHHQYQVLKAEFEKMKVDNQKQFDALDKKTKWNNDRLNLLATVQQENFLQVKNGTNNFVYFGSDWTIDKMPQYLELTQEDKEFLGKYLKK